MRSWLAARSHCHCTLLPSRTVRASAIARPLRKLASAASGSPVLSRISPMRSWLTDRSCCHSEVVRIAPGQRLGDLQALAIALERCIEPAILHVHVADAVAGHRQVALEAGIVRVALQQRLHLALGLGVGRHRRVVLLAGGVHIAQHGVAPVAQEARTVGAADLDLAPKRVFGRGKVAAAQVEDAHQHLCLGIARVPARRPAHRRRAHLGRCRAATGRPAGANSRPRCR